MNTVKRFTALTLAAAVAASAFVMSACNKDTKEEKKGTESSAETSVEKSEVSVEQSSEQPEDISAITAKPEITKEQLSSIDNFIAQYKVIPEFALNAEAIDAKSIAKDKKLSFIPDNSNNVFTSLVTDQFKKAGNTVGLKEVIADESDGTPAYYNSALEKAIKESNLVVMYGDINKDPLATNIELTQANGIKVLSAGYVGEGMKDHYVDYTIPIDYQLAGKLLADWAISKNKGKVNALAINNSDSTVSTSVYNGFSAEFTNYVTEGYCTVLSGASIEVGNGLTAKIKQALEKDANLNYIVVLDETMINDAVSAVDQSGKNLKIISTGGSTSAFTSAQSGKLDMLVAQSFEWTAYAMLDYSLRVIGEQKLPDIQSVPVRVVTKESIENDLENTEYEEIDGFYEICFGANFITGYRKLWGVEE